MSGIHPLVESLSKVLIFRRKLFGFSSLRIPRSQKQWSEKGCGTFLQNIYREH
jgi:hypothetical protein